MLLITLQITLMLLSHDLPKIENNLLFLKMQKMHTTYNYTLVVLHKNSL